MHASVACQHVRIAWIPGCHPRVQRSEHSERKGQSRVHVHIYLLLDFKTETENSTQSIQVTGFLSCAS